MINLHRRKKVQGRKRETHAVIIVKGKKKMLSKKGIRLETLVAFESFCGITPPWLRANYPKASAREALAIKIVERKSGTGEKALRVIGRSEIKKRIAAIT